ncbi:hypothetical protein [Beijerinckia sp. L45]|uniref:hypothetical protein n=1 Tax=Beijerinckia sp. L45 TaxID=1641855 RepID=UPI00131C9B46|nr:hypothetical protein [Beijerinckia sp. L45]
MERFGHSIFCDDIRNEAGGKLSFLGCYNGTMFVPATFPYMLPRFCVHVQIFSQAALLYKSLVVRCYAPGDTVLVEEPIQPPQVDEQMELVAHMSAEYDAPRYIVAGTSLIFSPLRIDGPGLLRVRAIVDGDRRELRLGSLRIEVKPDPAV